ncbi:S9 family peptidase [bacterium]|nr:S9 family peptidase [bacterium]
MGKTLLERYEQAQTLMKGSFTDKLVRNDTVFPHWIRYDDRSDSGSFWYRRQTAEGKSYRLVDVDAASNIPAFDHHALAEALSNAQSSLETSSDSADSPKVIDPLNLPLEAIAITRTKQGAPLQIAFQALNKYWHFYPERSELKEATVPQSGQLSPDGMKFAFFRDYNLWIRDQANGEEQALTQDGIEDYQYGLHLFCQDTLLWSADSKRILVTQLDRQKVRTVPHVHYGPIDPMVNPDANEDDIYPQLSEKKQAYPGDEYIPVLRLYAVDVITGQLQKADYPPIPPLIYSIWTGFFDTGLCWWSADNRRAFFIDAPRDSRIVRVVEWDCQTGATRVVIEETDEVTVRLRHGWFTKPLIAPLPDTDELIWFSERSGWGHLYLYDLTSGEMKHQITGAASSNGEPEPSAGGELSANNGGEWLVRDILHVDTKRRELLLQTAARDPSINPYYRDICQVNIDSGTLTPLVTGNFEYVVHLPGDMIAGHHMVIPGYGSTSSSAPCGVSPSGHYLITTRSRVDTVPVSVLIDRSGKEILTIETMDVSGLPNDWQWPEPVTLKGSDNTTDICAVVFRPPDFSPQQSYPVVDFISSTRSFNALPIGSFINNAFLGNDYIGAAALATLGFIVVVINGRGTVNRNKSFSTHHYGDHAFTSDFTDRIAGLRQLAERYPYMDLNRVGLSANENPSNNAIYGSLLYSDFYKVSVIHCLMDPRFGEASLSEAFEIAMSPVAPPKTPYPEECVGAFSGKLLLIQGMNSYAFIQPHFLLADALIKANKDFDMVCEPALSHSVSSYSQRREWDYLVTHLQGNEPPKQFHLTRGMDFVFSG